MSGTDMFINVESCLRSKIPPIIQVSNESSPSIIPKNRQTEIRQELLHQIRQRIKSGYYNRESVIDDIGYGFAQAIDSTL